MKTSAMSMKAKLNILTQQCFKRFHNTCEDIPHGWKVEMLEEFMAELYNSGYNEKERYNVLIGGYKTFLNLKMKEQEGTRPFYRKNEFNKSERIQQKQKKRNNWFKSGGNYTSVMFVDATPDDKLLKTLQNIEYKFKISENDRIKFVSKSGIKLKSLLQRKDPFDSKCNTVNCKPCENVSKGSLSKCREMNVTYKAQCKICEERGKERVYYGETCRNLNIRSKEHYKDCENKSKQSWMYKHIENEHRNLNGKECDFKWTVLNRFKKPMQRQLSEAINIDNTNSTQLLNLKNEYFKANIKGIDLHNKQFTCKYCSAICKNSKTLNEHIMMFHKQHDCEKCAYKAFGLDNLRKHKLEKHSSADEI